MRRILLVAALATTAAIAVPIFARSAEDAETQQAQAAPMGEQRGERAEHWMQREDGPGMRGGPMMMMRHSPITSPTPATPIASAMTSGRIDGAGM